MGVQVPPFAYSSSTPMVSITAANKSSGISAARHVSSPDANSCSALSLPSGVTVFSVAIDCGNTPSCSKNVRANKRGAAFQSWKEGRSPRRERSRCHPSADGASIGRHFSTMARKNRAPFDASGEERSSENVSRISTSRATAKSDGWKVIVASRRQKGLKDVPFLGIAEKTTRPNCSEKQCTIHTLPRLGVARRTRALIRRGDIVAIDDGIHSQKAWPDASMLLSILPIAMHR